MINTSNMRILYNGLSTKRLGISKNQNLYGIKWYQFIKRFSNWIHGTKQKVDRIAYQTLENLREKLDSGSLEKAAILFDTVTVADYAMGIDGRFSLRRGFQPVIIKLDNSKISDIDEELQSVKPKHSLAKKVHILTEVIKLNGTKGFQEGMGLSSMYGSEEAANKYLNYLKT